MDEQQILQFLKDRLRLRVEVAVEPESYENRDRVRVKVALLLDDEVVLEDDDSSPLPQRD